MPVLVRTEQMHPLSRWLDAFCIYNKDIPSNRETAARKGQKTFSPIFFVENQTTTTKTHAVFVVLHRLVLYLCRIDSSSEGRALGLGGCLTSPFPKRSLPNREKTISKAKLQLLSSYCLCLTSRQVGNGICYPFSSRLVPFINQWFQC